LASAAKLTIAIVNRARKTKELTTHLVTRITTVPEKEIVKKVPILENKVTVQK